MIQSLIQRLQSPNRNEEWLIYTTGNATEQNIKGNDLNPLPRGASNRDNGEIMFGEGCITPLIVSATWPSIQIHTHTSATPDHGFVQFNSTLEMKVAAVNGTSHWNTFTDDYLNLLGNNNSVQEGDFKNNNVLNNSASITVHHEVD